jgi:phospholipid transport system substrate-binding protein
MHFILLAFLMFMPSIAIAEMDPALQGKKAENFVRDLGNEAITALNATIGNEAARRAEFKRILNSKFDMDTIARFSLGRYWGVATDAEKRDYTRLFRDMVVEVYTQRFSEYNNQTLEVTGNRPAGRKDFIVQSVVRGTGQPIRVDWRVRNNKVIDVIVEGVSMSVTQRNDFAAVIQRNGGQVTALIDHLKK